MIDLSNIALIPPVENCPITQLFGERPEYYARYKQAGHNGIDYGCNVGTRVRAAARGVVLEAGWDATGYGNRVKIDHGEFVTIYAHLSTVACKRGQIVDQGEMIGASGNTGDSSGPHLHFELRIPSTKSVDYPQGAVNPAPFFLATELSTAVGGDLGESNLSNGEPGAVIVSVAGGANIRLTPGGQVLGAAPFGTRLVLADATKDWLGVILWVHTSVVSSR